MGGWVSDPTRARHTQGSYYHGHEYAYLKDVILSKACPDPPERQIRMREKKKIVTITMIEKKK